MVASAGLPASRRMGRVRLWRQGEYAQILPLLLLAIVFFDLPLLLTLGWSFRDPKGGAELSLSNYFEFFGSSLYLPVIWRTFAIAAIVTIVCALMGYPLALWMSRLSGRGRFVTGLLVVLPFWISILVRTYSWIVILGRGGIVNSWLQDLGLVSQPISFLYNNFGVVVGMINVLLPYLVLPLYAGMLRLDPRIVQMASTLGASHRQIFWRVFFPMTVPSLAAAMMLVFILSLGFYITPAVLGGGKVQMIATMLDFMINRYPHWELAAAISVCLLILTLTFYAAYQRIRRVAVT